LTIYPILIIFNVIQVVRSATLSRLYRMLGDFPMSPYTLVQKVLKVFRFLPLFHWH